MAWCSGFDTHIGLCDQTTAIESLPAPPTFERKLNEAQVLKATGTDGKNNRMNPNLANKRTPRERRGNRKMVPTVVPSGADIGAVRLASETNEAASDCTDEDGRAAKGEKKSRGRKPATRGELCASSHRDGRDCIAIDAKKREICPAGFEPATLGSEDCCATNATINHDNELRQTPGAMVPTVVPSASEHAPSPHIPADLARIAAAWDRLPNAIKSAILALIRAAQE